MKNILIELKAHDDRELGAVLEALNESNLIELDKSYEPVRIKKRRRDVGGDVAGYIGGLAVSDTYVVRGAVSEDNVEKLSRLPFVYQIWPDSRIDHFLGKCNSGKKGTLSRVAECIGAKQLWGKGYRGDGIVIGIVDGGVDKTQISAVVNGSRPDWGTQVDWNQHGNMTSTDALGIAPDAKIYDLRISGALTQAGTISDALQAFDWAIQHFAIDGTPHILSNSWGIYEENWDPGYATNPNHPFTLKVEQALDAGIKVLFAAGNCGRTCRLEKCGNDTGGGRDIWGANGHEEVMTVGAVKLNNHRLKYSSQGPAALFDLKPDFCGYSSFKGYFNKDTGTSAACPVVAGAVALLLDYDSNLTQLQIQNLLQTTAKDIEHAGFDHNTGYGVVRLDNAYYELVPQDKPKQDFRDKLCDYVYTRERQCVRWEEDTYQLCTQTRDDGYQACSQYRDQGYTACSQWADNGYTACSQWADNGYNSCCTWWPCSWGCKALVWIASWVCVATIWISNIVCVATVWITNIVCVATVWISNIVCVSWTWVIVRFCKLYLWIVTAITFTNCKCR